MAATAMEHGACPPPFLQLSAFPSKVGYLPGRFCAPVPTLNGTVECCLPCPVTDWVYSNDFEVIPQAASWLNVAGLVCSFSLLLSYFVLPIQKTSRHYLTVGLVAAVCLMQLGFVVPLAARPQQCHDAITPNDMYSDLTCAFSGAFLLFGGFAAIVWGFLRSLSIHLQICWQVVPGKKFFWCSLVAGWGIPAIIIAVALPVTTTSYRFGNTCHINHDKAIQDYWGPLLAFAAISTILQFFTFGYCIRVYIRALLNDSTVNSQSQVSSGGLPSYTSRAGSVKTLTPGQAYRRIRKVIALQWRGTVIVLIIIVDVVFLAVVFVQMDNTVASALKNFSKAQPWLLCLMLSQGDKSACLSKVREADLVTNEAIVIAVLFVLSLNGIWTLLFLGRTSMLLGWVDLFRRPFRPKQAEFVSVDARRFSAMSAAPSSNKHYEMITSPSTRPPSMPNSLASMPLKTGEINILASPSIIEREGLSPLPQSPRSLSSVYRDSNGDYFNSKDFAVGGITNSVATNSVRSSSNNFGKEADYRSPKLSFSTPRPPSAGRPYSRESSVSRPYSQRGDSMPPRPFEPQLYHINSSTSSLNSSNVATYGGRASHATSVTITRPFSPPKRSDSRTSEVRGRTYDSRATEWDPTSTYARDTRPSPNPNPPSPSPSQATVRADGLGKILGKDDGF